jgi:hypothetical protein
LSSVPEQDLARVRQWIEERNRRTRRRGRDQVRVDLDVDARSVTVVECRPPWDPSAGADWTRFPIARLRYTKLRREWTLYWRDRNERFHRFTPVPASNDVTDLLAAVDADHTGIFWG